VCRKKLAGEPYGVGEGFLRCAAENVRRNRADMVGVGRQSFADPEFARKILSGETSGISFCTTCGRCTELLVTDQKVWCAVFNDDYRNRYLEWKKGSCR
jgi:2,4-dienoyl-CoA reductase-like NADH-dependent reductase (Old Yellow Enzyme family)